MSEKLYSDDELLEELVNRVKELDGSITVIDIKNNIFKLEIDEPARDYASMMIHNILKEYRLKRAKLLMENPFLNVQTLIDEMKGKE
jgi:ribosome-interacting GTPase 1